MIETRLLPYGSMILKSKLANIGFLSLLLSVPVSAVEYEAPRFATNTHKMGIETSYYSTDGNFTNIGGAFDKLPSGQSLSLIQIKPRYDYVINSHWNLFGNLDITSGTSIGATETRKNSSLTGIRFGLNYGYSVNPLRIVPEFSILIPTKSIDYTSKEMIISDGLTEFNSSIWIGRRLGKRVQLNSKIGMIFRSGGRSVLFSWLLNANIEIGNAQLYGGLSGLASSSDDKDLLNASTRHDYLKTVNAGSLKFDSVNPEVMNAIAGLEYRWTKASRVGISAEMALNGKNMANGFLIMANAKWAWRGKGTKTEQEKKNQDPLFEPDFSNYDESLFEADDDLIVKPPKKKTKGR